MPEPRRLPSAAMAALRGAFLVAVVGFAWFGLRGRLGEVADAIRATSPAGVAGALVLVTGGLLATGALWRLLMARLGAPLPLVDGLATFFVGQLGKYIPGSVWSIGAQAELARRHTVRARVTVAAGLLFLGYHVDTAVLVAATTAVAGGLDVPGPTWVSWAGLAVALAGLAPPVVRMLGRRVADRSPRIGTAETCAVLGLMSVAWAAYALALVLLSPGSSLSDIWALGGAFAAAYAVGVVVVVAPAGVGAREAVFVLLLTPVTGVGPATALALLARVVHTVADGLLATGWWLVGRRGRVRPREREVVVS